MGGKGLRAGRAAGPRWSGCRSSGDSFGGLISRKRAVRLGIWEPCLVRASGELDVGTGSHASFGYFITDGTDGLVRPSSPRAHRCQGKLNLKLLIIVLGCASQSHRPSAVA